MSPIATIQSVVFNSREYGIYKQTIVEAKDINLLLILLRPLNWPFELYEDAGRSL